MNRLSLNSKSKFSAISLPLLIFGAAQFAALQLFVATTAQAADGTIYVAAA